MSTLNAKVMTSFRKVRVYTPARRRGYLNTDYTINWSVSHGHFNSER